MGVFLALNSPEANEYIERSACEVCKKPAKLGSKFCASCHLLDTEIARRYAERQNAAASKFNALPRVEMGIVAHRSKPSVLATAFILCACIGAFVGGFILAAIK